MEPGSTPRPLVQKKNWRDSLPTDMLLSAVSVLVVAQSSSEIPEGLMNNPVYIFIYLYIDECVCVLWLCSVALLDFRVISFISRHYLESEKEILCVCLSVCDVVSTLKLLDKYFILKFVNCDRH